MKPRFLHFLRRLGAIFYDCLLLTSVLFLSTLVLLLAIGGEAIDSNNIIYTLYLLSLSYLYFVWQWTHGGQTLGMRAWHLRLYQNMHATVSWGKASQRFFASILSWLLFGGGFLWSLIDKDCRTLHDHISNTCLKHEPGNQI